MYKILKVKDTVRVAPTKLSMNLKKAIHESLKEKYEGKLNQEVGTMLAIVDVEDIQEGIIKPMDAGIHYPVVFELLVYKPELHEVVVGEVIDIAEFGAFVRFGPMDGLVHVSQIMDDFVTYDEKSSSFNGKKSKRALKEGDVVRARIISISYEKESKIGLTMRQPGLGSLDWVKAEKSQAGRPAKPEGEKKGKSKAEKSKAR